MGMPRARFLAEHWPHRPHVHHGPLSRFEHLAGVPELEGVDALLRTAATALRVKAWLYDRAGQLRSFSVSTQEAPSLYRGGEVTVVVDGVRIPALDAWMEGLIRELETPMTRAQVNVYASPRGVGTGFHFDHTEVVLVQIRGEKTWRIAPGALPHVGESFVAGEKPPVALLGAPPSALRPNPRKITTHVLRPGSVMFLPRGYWHESKTSGTESLALTLTFNTFTWAKLLAGWVTHWLSQDPAWREPAFGAVPLGQRSPRAERRFRELVTAAASAMQDLDLAAAVESAAGIYSVLPAIPLRRAPGRLTFRASPPRLTFAPARGRPVEITLNATTEAMWRAIEAQEGVFEPVSIRVASTPPQVVGRFIQLLLDAGVLVVTAPPRSIRGRGSR